MSREDYRRNFALIDWSDLKPTPAMPRTLKDRTAFHVITDIRPYRSPITGEVIGGRRQHREHMRDHGVIEAGNEKQEFFKRDVQSLPDARQEIVQVMKEKGVIG